MGKISVHDKRNFNNLPLKDGFGMDFTAN